jgi:2-iminobutanoate/2-iminopropanoate deaminase
MTSFRNALIAATILAGFALPASAAEYLLRDGDSARAFSTAVVTDGGHMVFLAGEASMQDLNGKDITGDFEAQVHAAFARIEQTLKRAGGDLSSIVATTTYVTKEEYRSRFTSIRKEVFKSGNFPASVLMTIPNFGRNGIEVEIAVTAVIGDHCSAANSCLPK